MSSSADLAGLCAAVFGCAGPSLTPDERRFFATAGSVGLILFARNVVDPDQVRALVGDFRATVGRADAPVLIDQEGGRVRRLRPPHWRDLPPAARAGGAGPRAAWLLGRLIAADLEPLGLDVACAPVLDVPVEGADAVIGDRAFAREPRAVAALGRACAEGLLAGGVAPVIKHIPGHGRAMADTHHALPRVTVPEAELRAHDFAPFKALSDMPWAMTAHVVYEAIDELCATVSRTVIDRVIRGHIGFDGVLLTDDLSMNALQGALAERAEASRRAGCDLVLHCNGKLDEMEAVARAASRLGEVGARRLSHALTVRRAPQAFDALAGAAELGRMTAVDA